MQVKTLLMAVSAAGLAFAQPAAAATRSYESLPAKGVRSAAVERVGANVRKSEAVGPVGAIGFNPAWLILGAISITVISVAAFGGDGNKSPG